MASYFMFQRFILNKHQEVEIGQVKQNLYTSAYQLDCPNRNNVSVGNAPYAIRYVSYFLQNQLQFLLLCIIMLLFILKMKRNMYDSLYFIFTRKKIIIILFENM